jgi:hypothetical protein
MEKEGCLWNNEANPSDYDRINHDPNGGKS